jgi:hypothetical protein
MRAYTACLLLMLALTAPEPALAWSADARVTSVTAQLDVRDPEVARVELSLQVDVRSSFITSFDLAGLDSDFELLELEAPSGAGAPQVLQDSPGQLQLVWSDHAAAPHTGEHALRVVYATRHLYAANESGRRHIDWTLPRWPERLSNVRITVLGPPGLQPSQVEPNFGEHVELRAAPPDAGSLVTYTRVELPRLTGYRVQFDLPPLMAASASWSSWIVELPLESLRRTLLRDVWLLSIGLGFGSLIVAKRRVRRKRLVTPRMLVTRLEPPHFDGPIFGVAAIAPVLIEHAPSIALIAAFIAVASALERQRTRRPLAMDGEPQPVSRRHWLSAHAALDATTPTGVVALGALLMAAMGSPEPLRTTALICGWLATPLFFSGTRLATPREEPRN